MRLSQDFPPSSPSQLVLPRTAISPAGIPLSSFPASHLVGMRLEWEMAGRSGRSGSKAEGVGGGWLVPCKGEPRKAHALGT